MRSIVALAVSLLLVAAPKVVQAQNYSTDRFTIGEFTDQEGCFVRGDWTLPGRPLINFEIWLLRDQQTFVNVWSYGWSRPSEDDKKVLGVLFWKAQDRQIFALPAVPSGVEISSGDEPGLVAMLGEDESSAFLAAFADHESFTVVSRDTGASDDMPFNTILEGGLQGSSLAVSRLRTCVAAVARREDARRAREAGVAHITRDPFQRGD